ncbi:MAG: homoserine kinase, partial [Proteobacteria bacterium]|nr:homoserine kinase [Pseudomonadota bacterium]
YNIGHLKKLIGIKKGIENTNYLLITNKNKFILTIYEKRVNSKELPFFMHLMKKLNVKQINCPKPILNKKRKFLFTVEKKLASITSFVHGKEKKNHSLNESKIIGNNIAKLHLATKNIKLYRKNNLSLQSWFALNNLIKKSKSKKINRLCKWIDTILQDLKKQWPSNLPSGIIHADLFHDNIFFLKKKFSGFIDLYFSCNDAYVYDLAICINAICFDSKFKFKVNKAKALIKGYQQIRKLTQKEILALPYLLRGAAIRFYLTRLYDQLNQQKGAIVKVKNPNEFLQKIKFHLQFKQYEKISQS